MFMIRKEISIIISAILIVALMTSSPVSSVNVAGASVQNRQDFLYSVSVSPTFVRVQQGDFGMYDVQVLRGSDVGQFSIVLSLVSDSSLLKSAVSFYPPILNFKQGQTAGNSTLKINSQVLESGTTTFRVRVQRNHQRFQTRLSAILRLLLLELKRQDSLPIL